MEEQSSRLGGRQGQWEGPEHLSLREKEGEIERKGLLKEHDGTLLHTQLTCKLFSREMSLFQSNEFFTPCTSEPWNFPAMTQAG